MFDDWEDHDIGEEAKGEIPILDIATVSTTSIDEKTGVLLGSLELDAEGESGADAFEMVSPYGLASRPPDATEKDGAQCGYAFIGSRPYAMAFGDTRSTPLLAALKKGESMLYGYFGNFIRCKVDGTISLFTTTDGKVDGQAQGVFMNFAPLAWQFKAPWGKQTFDATGWHLNTISGAELHLGSIVGLPAPFDQLTSYIDMMASAVRIKTATLDVGIDVLGVPDVTRDFLAHAGEIQIMAATVAAIASAVSAALAATATALGPSGAAVTTAIAPIAGLVSTLNTQVTRWATETSTISAGPRLRSIVTAK